MQTLVNGYKEEEEEEEADTTEHKRAQSLERRNHRRLATTRAWDELVVDVQLAMVVLECRKRCLELGETSARTRSSARPRRRGRRRGPASQSAGKACQASRPAERPDGAQEEGLAGRLHYAHG